MPKYESVIQKIKNKKFVQQKNEQSSNEDDSRDDELNDESENEYDDEDFDSEDKNFIADDQDVEMEIFEAQKRQKREQKKQKKLQNVKSEYTKKHQVIKNDDSELEEDDYELINENNQKPKKLKKLHQIQDDSSLNSNVINQQKRHQSIFDDDNQIDSSTHQNQKVKNEAQDSRKGLFDQSNLKKEELQRKQQIFRKREDSTADDEERQSALNQQLQNLKDKFVVEDIDDLFCTQLDQDILNKDIPERLQLKLQDRFKPSQEDLVSESQWIFDNIIESLPASKESLQQQKIQSIQQKIQLTLQYFRCDNIDIPQIVSSRIKYLSPELDEDSIWQIFNLDIEYGKYEIKKKQIKTFLDQIKLLSNQQQDEIQNFVNSIYYLRNQKDLRDYEMLIDFYKSYFSHELDGIAQNMGKKLPGQKNSFVHNARNKKYDDFAKKFILSPSNFVENIQEDRLLHKPNYPPQKMKDLAKEYIFQNKDQGQNENQKFDKLYLQFVQDVCQYAAVELWCQPELRKIVKKFVKENGTVVTQPTEKGMKELDVLHSSYRVKRVNKRIQDIEQTDIFLDIIQNESIGLITYDIQVEKIDEFYNKIFDKYQPSEIYSEQEKKWQVARNEIKKIFCNDPNPMNKNKKNFIQIIIDEIKEELREESENQILKECKNQYQKLIQMGYFKIRDDEKPKVNSNNRQNNLNLIDDDFIQQRERLNVMGAILHPVDNRNFMTTIAIVDHYGELVAHRDFLNLIPPRTRRQDNNQQEQPRPGELEEKQNHQKSKRQFQEMLKQYQVDLIVVSADCLEARKLKKCLGEFASLKSYQDDDQSMLDNPKNEEEINLDSKEALVIWGRPEVPKLFASSHQSQKLLKNMPFVLKKAICLARFEQDPMNEVVNLWSPITSENQTLNLNLHPLQKLINKARLMDCLEEINIRTINQIGIDINILIDHEHQHNQMQFLSGLGPRKAQKFLQKLKQRGQPLQNRMDIWENKIIQKSCFMSCVNFLKVKVPPEKRNMENYQINILDQTRINPRDYEFMQRIAVYCIFGNEDFNNIDDLKKVQAINELIRNPDKLKELQHSSDFQDQIIEQKVPQSERKLNENVFDQSKNIDKFIKDFIFPFRDPREDKSIVRTFDDQKFPSNELFYCLIDESERNFKKGIIVSANVIRIQQPNGNQPGRILCRLENGLDANINENDADFFGSVNTGSIVQGRVDQIKTGQSNDENFSVSLKCKQSDLRRHDLYVGNHEDVPEQDLINLNFKVQEEQTQLQKKLQIQKRKIQHTRFSNMSSTTALQQLKKEDNGEFYFRPSSRGVDNLTLTWKFFENNIVHIDIKETEKAIGANIGSKLWINEECFDNLQEIVERYITQCNRLVREVTQHQKFQKCNDMDELNQILLKEKQENESSIPYKFTILDEYPQFVILAYVPKKDVVREFLKVKPKGYFFHHQYQYPFQNLINWFKKSFKTREYQVYLRKAQSPQRIVQFAHQQILKPNQQQKITLNNGVDGMQIESGNWGQNNEINSVKRENGIPNNGQNRNVKENDGWDDQSMKQSPKKNVVSGWGDDDVSNNVKEEKDKNGWDNQKINYQSPQKNENNFRGGAGRGRGGAQGGGRSCFKCGEEGHMSRECPNQDSSKQKFMNRGGAGRQNKCYNCDQDGHMSKDCTEPKKERGGGGGSKCFNCQKDGHMSRDCTEPRKERGPNKCFNCQQEGHMSRECQEPRKERGPRNGGDDQPPYKRQRNDDGGSFRRQNNQEGWKNQDDNADAWGKSSQNDKNQNVSQENGWGNSKGGQGDWGEDNKDSKMQSENKIQNDDAWGNNDNSKNDQNGWN